MKKIVFMFALVTFIICLTVPCFAAEPEAEHTVFSRAFEYAVRYKKELITVSGDGLIFIGLLLVRRIFKKKTGDIAGDLKSTKGDASETLRQQGAVVNAMNELIDGYNGMRASYDKNESLEDDRNRLLGAVMVQNTAMLKMLQSVYVNSRNLPQGVKDIVTLEYANTMKALGNDNLLCSIVEAVRERVDSNVALAPIDVSAEESESE